jgi:hypothetical protein
VRAVFINHCHPERDHVCGLRAGRFADALAARGHEVVLLCEAMPGGEPAPAPGTLAPALQSHDWSRPLVLACEPAGYDWARKARAGALPGGIRQAAALWSYLANGGMFPDWQAGMAPYLPVLADVFRPDVVWGTFGNTDTWRTCRTLAALSGASWVGDFKDNWHAFLPVGLGRWMAARVGDATHMTVFSMAHCDQADELFPSLAKTVLYSGVDDIADGEDGPAAGELTLTLTGSVYEPEHLRALFAAIVAWAGANPGTPVRLGYAGGDTARVRAAADATGLAVQYLGYLAQEPLHRLQAASSANIYVYNPRCLLHHKAVELLAQGRPVIAFPGETEEVTGLAAEIGGAMFACADHGAIIGALDMIARNPPPVPPGARRQALTWTVRAAVLERVLTDAAAKGKGHG